MLQVWNLVSISFKSESARRVSDNKGRFSHNNVSVKNSICCKKEIFRTLRTLNWQQHHGASLSVIGIKVRTRSIHSIADQTICRPAPWTRVTTYWPDQETKTRCAPCRIAPALPTRIWLHKMINHLTIRLSRRRAMMTSKITEAAVIRLTRMTRMDLWIHLLETKWTKLQEPETSSTIMQAGWTMQNQQRADLGWRAHKCNKGNLTRLWALTSLAFTKVTLWASIKVKILSRTVQRIRANSKADAWTTNPYRQPNSARITKKVRS